MLAYLMNYKISYFQIMDISLVSPNVDFPIELVHFQPLKSGHLSIMD